MNSILHSSLLFSIVVQVITGVIELGALFVKWCPKSDAREPNVVGFSQN